jgi:hypothetical protein
MTSPDGHADQDPRTGADRAADYPVYDYPDFDQPEHYAPAQSMPQNMPPHNMLPPPQWPPAPPTAGAPFPPMLAPPSYLPYPMPPSTNGMAIASLVCSLLSLPLIMFCGIPTLLAGLTGVGLGLGALVQISNRPQPGKGLAIAGIVVGVVAILLCLVGLLWLISSVGDRIPDQR